MALWRPDPLPRSKLSVKRPDGYVLSRDEQLYSDARVKERDDYVAAGAEQASRKAAAEELAADKLREHLAGLKELDVYNSKQEYDKRVADGTDEAYERARTIHRLQFQAQQKMLRATSQPEYDYLLQQYEQQYGPLVWVPENFKQYQQQLRQAQYLTQLGAQGLWTPPQTNAQYLAEIQGQYQAQPQPNAEYWSKVQAQSQAQPQTQIELASRLASDNAAADGQVDVEMSGGGYFRSATNRRRNSRKGRRTYRSYPRKIIRTIRRKKTRRRS